MKSFLTLFFLSLLLMQGNVFAQSDDSLVWYVADWRKGEMQQYKVTKNTLEYKNAVQTKNTTNSYLTSVRVAKVTKKYFELEWKHQQTLFNNTPALPENVAAVARKHKLDIIKYRTSPDGAFIGIENWKELSNMMQDLFKEITTGKSEVEVQDLKQVIQPLVQAYSSKEGLEQIVFKELFHFHSPYGAAFSRYDTVTYDDEIPNMTGGSPIRAIGKVYYADTVAAANTTLMVNELNMDPEDSRRMVAGLVERMAGNLTSLSEADKQQRLAQIKESMAGMQMDIRDYNTFLFDNTHSWPVRITIKRITLASAEDVKVEKTEEIIIEQVK